MTILRFIIFGLVSGCTTIVPISQRPAGGPGEYHVHGRKIEGEDAPKDLYVKNSTYNVVPKAKANRDGSLYQDKDARNYLFTEKPLQVGGYIDVEVASNRLSKGATPDQGGPAAGGDPAAPGASGNNVEETLIKSLPNLDPGESNPGVVKHFRMTVTSILENGDFLVAYDRESKSEEGEANALRIKARVPHDALAKSPTITTNDLFDVEYIESLDGQVVERRSSMWEDEYTLRMSGFTEARSRAAQALEDKRKQLESVRKQTQTRIESLGKERMQVAKERDRLAKEKAEMDQKQAEMNRQIEELKQTLKEQQETIEDLQGDKPEAEKQAKKDEGANNG